MELLVATLVAIQAGRDPDAQAHIRQIVDTTRSAIGVIASRLYRGQEHELYYLLLTTWEDEDSWRKAREQCDPHLYLQDSEDLLSSPVEQWLMHYQWGYSRPARPPVASAVHISSLHPQQSDVVQQIWLHGLREQALSSTLTFAFLARGMDREATEPRRIFKVPGEPHLMPQDATQYGSVLLSFFSWASEMEREEFYSSTPYHKLQRSVEKAGKMRTFSIDQV